MADETIITLERAWRKAIADQVRANCTPTSEAYEKGGDVLVYAVADWIENPPEWSAFTQPPAAPQQRYSILEHNSASREILRWHDPLLIGGPGWWESVMRMTGHDWSDAVDMLETLLRGEI